MGKKWLILKEYLKKYRFSFQIIKIAGGKCGICGEDFSKPKQYEKGGSLYRGHTVRTYQKGSTISVTVEVIKKEIKHLNHILFLISILKQLTANHLGYYQFKICNIDGLSTDATQACLDKTVLVNQVTKTTQYPIGSTLGKVTIPLTLPAGLTCNQCVFQVILKILFKILGQQFYLFRIYLKWKYNTGN